MSAEQLDVELPMPPSTNNLYRNATTKQGVPIRPLTGEGKRWKADAIKVIGSCANHQGFAAPPKSFLDVTIHYYAPNVLVWDLDGKTKLLLDALSTVLGVDDRYIIDLRLRKRRSITAYLRMRVLLSKERV